MWSNNMKWKNKFIEKNIKQLKKCNKPYWKCEFGIKWKNETLKNN